MYRIVTGKDGRMQTDDADPTAADPTAAAAEVKRMRKELRDMLDGNVQFHEDPRAAPVEQPQAQVDIDFAEFLLLANALPTPCFKAC